MRTCMLCYTTFLLFVLNCEGKRGGAAVWAGGRGHVADQPGLADQPRRLHAHGAERPGRRAAAAHQPGAAGGAGAPQGTIIRND